jgi:hypothetical protein
VENCPKFCDTDSPPPPLSVKCTFQQLVSEWVPSTQFKHWKVDSEEMGGQIAISTNEAPLFDGTNYSSWRENMKRYLKSRGSGVWDSVVSKPWHLTTSKRKTKTAKEARRNNSLALKAIQDGLSDQVKENMRHYKSAKELWLQLENCYQNEAQEEEKSYQSKEQDSDKEDSCQNKEQNSEEENSYQDKEQDKEKENSNQIEEHNTEKEISNQNEMQDLMQTSVNNEEDNLIKELRHTSVITKEKLHNLKTDVTVAIEEIRMEPGNCIHIKVLVEALDNLEYTTMCTLEELEKLQQKYMLLLQQLDQSNHEEHEQKIQLENKEEEIKRLKPEVANLTEEMEELKTHDNKRK